MSMNVHRDKPTDERNKFDIRNDNEASRKAFEKNLREHPEPPPINPLDGPRSKGGILETPTVTEARLAMVAEKLEIKATNVRTARIGEIDEATITALVESWVRSTPAFLVTRHNQISFARAIETYIYRSGYMVTIPILNDIFATLQSQNYLERSRGSRVRGANGIMVSGETRMYPALVTTEAKQEAAVQSARSGVADRVAEDKANRQLSDAELAARARAGYKPNSNNIRVI
jgi:hypothetical protein